MKVISESYLRGLFRRAVPETFKLEEGQILTPSASQLLGEKRIQVIRGEADSGTLLDEPAPQNTEIARETSAQYVSDVDGGCYETKPEHMTEISGNRLVHKDHPRIVFRGRIDSCQSELLLLQFKANGAGKKELVADLSEIFDALTTIKHCELEDIGIVDRLMIGLSADELRAQAQNPRKHFGIDHFSLNYEMGEVILGLNRMKALVRELEVVAVTVHKGSLVLETASIVSVLNRVSSALYIMMLKEYRGIYK